MIDTEQLKNIEADIAVTDALLDQAQAHYNEHKHLWTEEYGYQVQSDIDTKRFHVELSKLQLKMLKAM